VTDAALWRFLLFGWTLTTLMETPVLLAGLSSVHSLKRKLLSALWLNACSYPIVIIVIPQLFDPTSDRTRYLWTAEIFAPFIECGLFYIAFDMKSPRRIIWRDMLAIVAANLVSFGLGEWLGRAGIL
jgi:hypothetical protein